MYRHGWARLTATALALAAPLPAHTHILADGLIVTRNGHVIVHAWQGTVTGSIPVPFLAATPELHVTFLDPDSVLFEPGPPGQTWLKHFISNPASVRYDSLSAWSFDLYGRQDGASGLLFLRIWFQDHIDFTSPGIPYFVSSTSDGATPTTQTRLTAWPNPARGATMVEYAVDRVGQVRLALYDAAGRQRWVQMQEGRPGGIQRLPLPTAQLPSGVYVLRLDAAGVSQQRKIQVVR